MRTKPSYIATIAALLVAGTASAQSIAIGGHASTLGLGAEVTISTPMPRINLRGGFNIFEYSYDTEEDGIDYEFDLHLKSLSALVDLYPAGGFRLSAGLVLNDNNLDAVATPNTVYEIGDNSYPAALVGFLTGELTFDRMVPYAGIGFGNAMSGSRLTVSVDLGVLLQGKPEATLTASGPISLLPSFQDDLRKEEENLNDDLKDFRYYPVLGLAVSYRF